MWWCPFKYRGKYESLQIYEKVTPSQMLSNETCEVLHNKLLKKTAGRLLLISSNILNASLVLSAVNQLIV